MATTKNKGTNDESQSQWKLQGESRKLTNTPIIIQMDSCFLVKEHKKKEDIP